jgi:hypothetical protein
MKACGSHLLLEKRVGAEIDHHRVKTPLEPAIRRRPVHAGSATRKAHSTAVELILEDFAAHLLQILASLFLLLTFWKQIDLRLSPEIFQTQLVARGIRPMQPIQEWLASPQSLFG